MTIRDALISSYNILKKKSASPHLDGEVLLSYVLQEPKEFLSANPDLPLNNIQYSKFNILVRKRARHWPVAYLIAHKEFFGLNFKVTPDVLIPRPETELLVERALAILKAKSCKLKAVVDVGTGSGNIIISIAKNLPGAKTMYALDPSPKALKIARLNAHRHGVSNKIKFMRGNLLSPILHSKFYIQHSTLILANLPYLTPSEYRSNPDLHREPRSALVAGPAGLKYFRELFNQLSNIPYSTFHILLEHSPTQKPALKKLAKKYLPYARISFHRDLAGKYRVAEIKF